MNLRFAKGLDRWLGSAACGLLGAVDGLRSAGRPLAAVGSVKRILVIKFWGLGNWALLRPVVRDLRARWPHARLTIATLSANRPLVADLADDVLLVRPRGLGVVGMDLLRAVFSLRRHVPDLALDFEQFSRAGSLLARLGGARQRVGFASSSVARDSLYSVLVPFRSDTHASRSFRDLGEAAGLAPEPYEAGALSTTERARATRASRLGTEPYVVLHPGSGDNFPGRRWAASSFAAVARTALAVGHRVVITGSAAEADLASRVARAAGPDALSLAGCGDLDDLVAVVEGARVLVSNDTGPVHLASALGVPTLAIFGPNTPVLYGPLAQGSRAFYRRLPCSPCLTTTNYRTSRCRIHTCTASIRTGEVATALTELLDRRPTPASDPDDARRDACSDRSY